MNTHTIRSLVGFSLTFIGLCGFSRAAETYQVDPVHSSVIFKAKHLGVSNFYGRFNEIAGTVTFDKETPSNNSVTIEVKAESVDTRVEKRNQHLKSPDFLNAKQFPVMTFKSKEAKKTGEDTYEVTGDFTLHGVTKPLTVEFKKVGEGKGMKDEYRAGGETHFTIKRSDFGITFMPGGIGEEIDVILSVEGIRK